MRLITLDLVESTNSYCLGNPQLLSEPFLAVRAVSQSAGRGRFSRIWESQPGKDLTFSFIVHPTQSHAMACAAAKTGIAARRALNAITGIKPSLKWPNDLLWQGKKLGGILVEHDSAGGHSVLVIGVGINLNSVNIDVVPPAVSVKEITGKDFDPEALLKRIVEEYEPIADQPLDLQLISEYNAACPDIGRTVTFSDGRSLSKGTISGIDSDGAIILIPENGPEVHYRGEIDYV